MIEDAELLRRYAEENSEDAFAELVGRRIGLVYSVALRHTHDAHRAEDATQRVFVDLARKAGELARRPVIVGWLYRSAQFAASDAVRVESRRQMREQEAHIMQEIDRQASEPDWNQLRPVLDEVLNEMDERDRDAVLLRFFDGQPFAEIGAKLRLTENAARMRVERALDKLREILARRGVTSTTAALGLALANQAGAAAPAGLAASVTGAALAGAAGVGGGLAAVFMSMTKLQIGIAAALAMAGVTAYVSQGQTQAALRQEIAALHEQKKTIAALRVENRQLAGAVAEVEALRQDDAELVRLSQEVKQAQSSRQAQRERERDEAARLGKNEDAVRNLLALVDRLKKDVTRAVDAHKALTDKANDPSLTPEANERVQLAIRATFLEVQTQQQILNSVVKRVVETGALSPEEAAAMALPSLIPESGKADTIPQPGP